MGLYSTNRVVQLANYNESAIDFEHIDTDESAPNLLESSIMLHEADQQMFDTLIGLDFVEAHNEQAMLEDSNSTDDAIDADYVEVDDDDNPKDTAKSSAASSDVNKAVSKNIFQKIVDIIQKAIEVVKNAIKTAINKVREFINNTANKVVVARLKKYDWSKFKEFKVKFDPTGMSDITTSDALKKITELKTLVSSADIDNESPEYLETKITEITGETKLADKLRKQNNTKKTDTEYTVTASIAKRAVNIISTADKTISDLNKAGNEATTALLKLKQRVGKPKGDDAKAANNLYSFATKASKAVTKLTQAAINEHVNTLKVARAIAFKIGRGKAKASDNAKANTTNNNESAYDSFVGSISDIYVENYFADLFD